MEAATSSRAAAARSSISSDRELALRLGSLMLCSFGSDGGAVIRAIDESGLNFPQMKVLVALAGETEGEPATVKLVSERLGLSLPSASRSVDELVKRKLATRVEDPNDRRVRRVSLTAEGQEIADELMAARPRRARAVRRHPDRRRATASSTRRSEVLLQRDDIAETYRTHSRRVAR